MLYGKAKVMDIKVHKNFMDPLLFLKLKETITGAYFPWFKSRIVKQTDDIQLIHTFFEFGRVNSEFFELLDPCIRFLKMKKLIRAKVNLVLRADKIKEHGYHVDTDGYKEFRSALLYVNSNNGYTRFEKNNKKIRKINKFTTLQIFICNFRFSYKKILKKTKTEVAKEKIAINIWG